LEHPFIVKVQFKVELPDLHPNLLIYDRKREFIWEIARPMSEVGVPDLPKQSKTKGKGGLKKEVGGGNVIKPRSILSTEEAREVVARLSLVVTTRGIQGRKAFLWARKISDDELTLCMDSLPAQNFAW
jgi:hypothetical protein